MRSLLLTLSLRRTLTLVAVLVPLTTACIEEDGDGNVGDPCDQATAPLCCVDGSDEVRDPTCQDGQWVCEAGTTAAASCELEPPPTPALAFVEDGTALEFDETELRKATTQSLRYCGLLDPVPDGVDDERTLCLVLDLDAAGLAAAALDTPLTVSGTTVVAQGSDTMSIGEVTFTPDANHDAPLDQALVEQACFCDHYGEKTQAFSGTLRVTARDDAKLTLAVDLDMNGNYTFDGFNEPRLLQIDGAVELDVCPAGPMAPLGPACPTEGVVCAYGYDIPGCGGRTVHCLDGQWTELEHTDPTDCPPSGQ